jgi:hypothetical protein
MITYPTDPEFLAAMSDTDLIKAYQESGGEAGDPRADELAAEIARRHLDL